MLFLREPGVSVGGRGSADGKPIARCKECSVNKAKGGCSRVPARLRWQHKRLMGLTDSQYHDYEDDFIRQRKGVLNKDEKKRYEARGQPGTGSSDEGEFAGPPSSANESGEGASENEEDEEPMAVHTRAHKK